MGIQILLVEYDQAEGECLSSFLRDGGHDAQRVSHPSQIQPATLTTTSELLLMEQTWPEHELTDMLLALRANMRMRSLPVIVLSRHGDACAKITALDTNAGDYVAKPCNTGELHAHVRTILRRRASHQHGDDTLQIDGLHFDPLILSATAQTETGPRAIALSPLEFRLLHFLVAHPQRVHSRTQLLDRVWGNYVFVGKRTVDVHIRKLCVALTGTPCDGLVQTVYGGGYRLMASTGDTTTVHTAETVGMQSETVIRRVELPVYGRVPTTHSLGPA